MDFVRAESEGEEETMSVDHLLPVQAQAQRQKKQQHPACCSCRLTAGWPAPTEQTVGAQKEKGTGGAVCSIRKVGISP